MSDWIEKSKDMMSVRGTVRGNCGSQTRRRTRWLLPL